MSNHLVVLVSSWHTQVLIEGLQFPMLVDWYAPASQQYHLNNVIHEAVMWKDENIRPMGYMN